MHAGSLEAGEAALAPIREADPALDAFAPTPYAAFQSSLDDPPGYRNWWTAEFLDDLGAPAVDAICALAEETWRPVPPRSSSPPGAARSRAFPTGRPR